MPTRHPTPPHPTPTHSPSHKVTYQKGSHRLRPFGPSGREPWARSVGPALGWAAGRRPSTPRGLHGCRGARTTGEPEFLTQDSSPGLLPRPPPQAGLRASGPARRTALHCGPSPAPRPGSCRPRTSTLSPQASNSSLFLGYVNVSEESLPPL